MGEDIDLSLTGIYKTNTIKTLIKNITEVDSIYGEDFVELMCVYLIRAIQNSFELRKKVHSEVGPMTKKAKEIAQMLEESNEQAESQNKNVLSS